MNSTDQSEKMVNQYGSVNPVAYADVFIKEKSSRLSSQSDWAVWITKSEMEAAETVCTIRKQGVHLIHGFFPFEKISSVSSQVTGLIRDRKHLRPVRDHRSEIEQGLVYPDVIYVKPEELAASDRLEDRTTTVSIQDPLVNIDGLAELILDERLIEIATAYFGCIPKLTFLKVFESFATDMPAHDTQVFHKDGGGYSILKALIYLNDVDDDGGPFTYALGSHALRYQDEETALREPHRYSDEEAADAFGADAIKKCSANLGDLLLGETTGLHKGGKPQSTSRKIIIVNFGVHDELGFDYPHLRNSKETYEALSPVQKMVVEHLENV